MAVQKPRKQSMLSRCLKAPLQFLVRAKDFYMKSITGYSDQLASYGSGTVVCAAPTQPVNLMPRSFSANSAKSTIQDDDYRELLRAASTRSLRDKPVSNHVINVRGKTSPKHDVARARIVAIGRIEEDAPFIDLGDEVKLKHVVPRSRSQAGPYKTTTFRAF